MYIVVAVLCRNQTLSVKNELIPLIEALGLPQHDVQVWALLVTSRSGYAH